ncbi:MAG: hypothetical protein LBC63_09885, partial [Holophagales bacterium]|nr:hypothetical protein [Holophagales bacterium]
MFGRWVSMLGKLLVAAILLSCPLFGDYGPKIAGNGTQTAVSGQESQDSKKPSADMILKEVNLAPIFVVMKSFLLENESTPELEQVYFVINEYSISELVSTISFESLDVEQLKTTAIWNYFGIEKNKKSAIFVNGSLSKTYPGLPDPKDIQKLAESLLADLNRELKANPRNSSLWLGSITRYIEILNIPSLGQEYVKKNNINVTEWSKDLANLFYKMHLATDGLWQNDPTINLLAIMDQWIKNSTELDIKNPFFDAIIEDLNKEIQSDCTHYKYAWLWNYFFPKTSSAYTNPASLIPELEHMPYTNIDACFYKTVLDVLFQMKQYDLCISLCNRVLEPFELEGEQLEPSAVDDYRLIVYYLVLSLFEFKEYNKAFEVMRFWEKKSILGWDWSDFCNDDIAFLVDREEQIDRQKWFQFFEESVLFNASLPKPQAMSMADKVKAWVNFATANPDNVAALRMLAQNIKSVDEQDKNWLAKKLLGVIENNALYIYNLNLSQEDLYLDDATWQKLLNAKIAKLYQDLECVPMDKTRWAELFYCIKNAKQK